MAKRKSLRASVKTKKPIGEKRPKPSRKAARPGGAGQRQMGLRALAAARAEGKARYAQSAGRQGRRPRRNGQSRPAGAARLHHHHRGLHLLLRQQAAVPERASNAQVEKALAQVGRITGKIFGDKSNPLLVSVRSGARASMPGMMDTVLNLGLNDETVEALAKKSGDRRFAYDSYRRFITMYSDVVLGVGHEHFEELLDRHKERQGYSLDTDLTADDWAELVERYKKRVQEERGEPFPQDPHEQLWGAIGAVFGSWMNQRANTYRRLHNIPESWGTAVNVQAMVFGNMGDTSATGVAFTRNPSTGEKKLYGEFLINAQGEDVVAGIRTPQEISEAARIEAGSDKPSMENTLPKAYCRTQAHLQHARAPLPRHAGPRIHGRAGQAVDAADPQRQTHRQGRAAHRGRARQRRPDHQERGGAARRSAGARSAPASDHRSARAPQGDRDRPAGLARRRLGRDRVLAGRSRATQSRRQEGDPGAGGNLARRHSRHARGRRHPHHPRRHDLACGGGRARHGQALRLRRRHAARRLRCAHHDGRRQDASSKATSSPSTARPARCWPARST